MSTTPSSEMGSSWRGHDPQPLRPRRTPGAGPPKEGPRFQPLLSKEAVYMAAPQRAAAAALTVREGRHADLGGRPGPQRSHVCSTLAPSPAQARWSVHPWGAPGGGTPGRGAVSGFGRSVAALKLVLCVRTSTGSKLALNAARPVIRLGFVKSPFAAPLPARLAAGGGSGCLGSWAGLWGCRGIPQSTLKSGGALAPSVCTLSKQPVSGGGY